MPKVSVRSSASYNQYRDLSKRLRGADRELQKDLRKRIRVAGQPALAAVRSAAGGVDMTSDPSAGGTARSSGLRGRLAAATRMSVTASGVRFQVQEKRVDPRYGATLTAGSEGTAWRHPVYGNRNAWVRQQGSPWFYPTLRSETPSFRRAVEQAVRDTLKTIEG